MHLIMRHSVLRAANAIICSTATKAYAKACDVARAEQGLSVEINHRLQHCESHGPKHAINFECADFEWADFECADLECANHEQAVNFGRSS